MVEVRKGNSIKKFAAFTLFESTVAISIITVLIAIGTHVYGNVFATEKPVAFYQAREEIDKLYTELKETKAFFSTNYEYGAYEIEQKIEVHNGNRQLLRITYMVTSGGKTWWKEQHLIANEADENEN